MKQQLSSLNFADLLVGQRRVKQTFFSQIDKIIDWNPSVVLLKSPTPKVTRQQVVRAMIVLCCSR